MSMEPIFKYTSMAAAAIATEEGFFNDSERVRRLAYALYEAAIKCEPHKCPTRWADGAVTVQRTKPCQKAKREI